MKKILQKSPLIFFTLIFFAPVLKAEEKNIPRECEKISKELQEVMHDRDNLLKQTKNFIAEKENLAAQLQQKEGADKQILLERDSLKKEIDLLKTQMAEEKNSRLKDRELHQQELQVREKAIAELEAKNISLSRTFEEYSPEKIQQLVADRNRLEEENKRMAARVLEVEKRMDEMKNQMKPFQLDREEMYKLRSENKEMQKKISYVQDLEQRQQQLLKENAEYREKVEVLKAKFKEAVPGLAKSGRISQKMMRENADMHYNLGTIFLNNKQFKEAIREYERVLELRANDPDTHYNLGVLYDDYMKDREKALYHYQKYLAINPKAADAKKVETYILSLELEQKVR